MSERAGATVVIGLGNPLMGDDGLGLAAVARLQERYVMPPSVLVVDGGTWGMNLLPTIEGAGRLLLVDAINNGMPPGTEVVLDRTELPKVLALKVSPHQIDMREVLALTELRGTLPDDTLALGLQPERVEMGLALSPRLAERLDHLVETIVYQLALWGESCPPRVGQWVPQHA